MLSVASARYRSRFCNLSRFRRATDKDAVLLEFDIGHLTTPYRVVSAHDPIYS